MSALVAALVVATAVALQRARTGRPRPWAVQVGRWPPAWASTGWQRLGVRPAAADPAPLLRFRTAIERGASVLQAFESVAAGTGRWASGARRLVHRVRAGSAVLAAADDWADEDPDPSVRLLADALAISATTGGSHLRAVDAVIDAVRDRAALQREVRALASQAQASAVVLVLLPMGFAVAVALVDPRVRGFYVGSPLGPVCVAAGLLLDAVGAWIMARLVRSVA
jgi:tight adherence protein B